MQRLTLERNQVWIYLAAIGAGLVTGLALGESSAFFEALLWPAIALLLFATFLQVPLLHLLDAFKDHRFSAAVLIGNFVVVPLLLWPVLMLLPDDPALKLGVLMVLLVPCTDWFITFTQLGKGDTARAIAIAPALLMLQLLLLPLYLWPMMGAQIQLPWEMERFLPAAVCLIALPLLAALAGEQWIETKAKRAVWRERAAWSAVPLLAVVVFLIAAAQINAVMGSGGVLLAVLPVFAGFLIAAALIAKLLARLFKLPPDRGRTLAFSLGTRNSFVVLPMALALPAGWESAVVVIVFQSLIELLGMVFYLWWLPKKLFVSAPH